MSSGLRETDIRKQFNLIIDLIFMESFQGDAKIPASDKKLMN